MMKTRLFKGKPLYSGLSTKYLVIEKLIEDLANKKFTGYLEISFKDGAHGELLFLDGDSIGASYYSDKVYKNDEAKRILFESAKDKEGEIGVYELRKEQAEILRALMEGVPFNIDLSTSFVMLDKLIDELRNISHTGYMSINFENGSIGMLIFREGEVVDGIFEGILEGEEITIKGKKAKNVILSNDVKGTIHIYAVDKDKFASFSELKSKIDVPELLPSPKPKVIEEPEKPHLTEVYQYIILEIMKAASSQPSLGPNMAFSIVKKTIIDIKKENFISISKESEVNLRDFNSPEHMKEVMNFFFKQLKINFAVIVGVKTATNIIYEAIESAKRKFGPEIEKEIEISI